MKYAIISDIHANAKALRRVLDDIAAQHVDQVICLGDVVGYGPLPKETLALVRKAAQVVVAGNHDDAVSGRRSTADFIDLAADSVRRHREALDGKDIKWLGSLPHECAIEGAVATHGDFLEPKRFAYIDSEETARANFDGTHFGLMFAGHTHVPGFFRMDSDGTVVQSGPRDFALAHGVRYIVNPGSVGYPCGGNGESFSSYVVYDSNKRTVAFRKMPFDISSVMQCGKVPRRRNPALALAAGAFVLLAAGGAFLAFRASPPEASARKTATAAQPVDQLPLAEKTLTLGENAVCVQANLKVKKAKNGSVLLRVVFRSASGEVLGRGVKTVAASSRERIKVPAGAASVRFSVHRIEPGDEPQILSFAPSATAR